MRETRIYVPELPGAGAVVPLPVQAAQHIGRVLRMRVGQSVRVFDGRREFHAVIETLGRHRTQIKLRDLHAEAIAPVVHLTLAISVVRGERMDWVCQKASELGVAEIRPVLSERSRRQRGQALSEWCRKRKLHWQQIVIGACEQCGRIDVPAVHDFMTLGEYLSDRAENELMVFADREAVRSSGLPRRARSVSMLVGPEGGWTRNERTELIRRSVIGVRLGPRILRSETAGLVMLTLMQARYGDLAS